MKMDSSVNQSKNTVKDGDIVARDKIVFHQQPKTKLANLFERLKEEFEDQNIVDGISDNLKKYQNDRDVIGLEQKLIDGGKQNQLDDAKWLKEEYYKKLTKFQFYEPAQEIHAFLLSVVHEKFRNLVRPKIEAGASNEEISTIISNEIITPIMTKIEEEGCDDIMGLSANDIDGMIFFLTGKCHIKWTRL